jgi:hypothetical protein
METIYTHDPSPDELELMFLTPEARPTEESSDDYHLACLARLFAIRGDEARARSYAEQIADPSYRHAVVLSVQELS